MSSGVINGREHFKSINTGKNDVLFIGEQGNLAFFDVYTGGNPSVRSLKAAYTRSEDAWMVRERGLVWINLSN